MWWGFHACAPGTLKANEHIRINIDALNMLSKWKNAMVDLLGHLLLLFLFVVGL